MILAFKAQFEEPILTGSKVHTIREDKNKRWKVGTKIHFATGVRTNNYNQFYTGVCKAIQEIEIKYLNDNDIPDIYIDGRDAWEEFGTVSELSRNDGFETIDDFLKWFHKDFKGRIIHWTELTYNL